MTQKSETRTLKLKWVIYRSKDNGSTLQRTDDLRCSICRSHSSL